METKILWQYDSTFEQTGGGSSGEDKEFILKNMLEFAQSVARPTTKIVMDFPLRRSESILQGICAIIARFLPWRYSKGLSRLRKMVSTQRSPGVCYGEFFLQDARQAVKIPVVGPAESAMMMAQLVGAKFAVVTLATEDVHTRGAVYGHNVVEQNLRALGWENRAIKNRPVRPFCRPTLRS